MDIAYVLFALRVLSTLALIAILAGFFILLWRDYRATVNQVLSGKRAHGFLVALQEIDGMYVQTGDIYPLLPLTSMGRAPTNTIIIDDKFASNEHAIISRRNGQWWLEDRKSRNGTLLNQAPVVKPVVLTNGDVVGIGNLHFRIDIEG